MALALYMDQHVPRAITTGLRIRGVDVLTAYEDGASRIDDASLLERASALDRVLFTRDADLLAEGTRRQREGIAFLGVIYAHQRIPIGTCVADLQLIAEAGEPADLVNRAEYLPL